MVNNIKSFHQISLLKTLPLLSSLKKEPLDLVSSLLEQYGDLVKVNILGLPVFITSDYDWGKCLFIEQELNLSSPDNLIKCCSRYDLQNILTANDQTRNAIRSHYSSSFNKKNVLEKSAILEHRINLVLNELSESSASDSIPVLQIYSKLMISLVFELLYDFPIEKFSDDMVDLFYSLSEYFLDDLTGAVVLPLNIPSKRNQKINALMSRFYSNIDMAAREASATSGRNFDDLRYEMRNLFIFGLETPASVLAWATYILSDNQQLQASLRNEINSSETIEVSKLESFMNEVMRLYPPGYFLARQARQDFKHRGVKIRKGSQIILATYQIHRSSSYYEEPNVFRLDRFISSRPKEFFPFGLGGHVCTSKYFAHTMIKRILTKVLGRFEISARSPTQIQPLARGALSPGVQLRCTFKQLSNNST